MEHFFGKNEITVTTDFQDKSDIIMLHGDAMDTLKSVPSDTVKLIISSPPYNLDKEYESKMDLDTYLESLNPILDELVRVLAVDGSLCWQVGNYVKKGEIFPLDIHYYPIFKSMGLKLRNRIIWHFGHGLHGSKRFSGRYETLLWFTKSDSYIFNLDPVRVPSKYPGKTNYKPGPNYGKPSGNPLGKNPSDFWEIIEQDWDRLIWEIPNVKANHPEKTIHPCQFPIELVQRCVLALTNTNDLVLDPFAGVGTVMIASTMHDRRSILCEKEKKYLDEAKIRLNDFLSGNLRIRPLGKPVYQPTGKEKVSQIPMEWLEGMQNKADRK